MYNHPMEKHLYRSKYYWNIGMTLKTTRHKYSNYQNIYKNVITMLKNVEMCKSYI